MVDWCVRAVGWQRGREGRRGEECPHGEVVSTATTTRSGVIVQSAGDGVAWECPHGEVVGTATTTRSGVFVQSAGGGVAWSARNARWSALRRRHAVV